MMLCTLVMGMLDNNCYLLADEDGTAVVIDPTMHADRIQKEIDSHGWHLGAILLTHAHFDHVGAADRLAANGAPIYLDPADVAILPEMSHGKLTSPTVPYPDELTVGKLRFTVLRTPGHSPGSVCLLTDGLLFTGDTLFCGSCGRTDFVGGDPEAMLRSLRMLSNLNFEGRVLPGHDGETTLARERAENPYMRMARRGV